MSHSNLFKRIVFALWAIPVGWWVINSELSLLPPSVAKTLFDDPTIVLRPGHLVVIIITFLGLYEYLSMLSLRYSHNAFWLVYFWFFFQLTSYFMPIRFTLSRSLDTYILLMLVALEAAIWGRKEGRWKRASLLFSGTVFLSIAGQSMLNFYSPPLQEIFPRRFDAQMLSQVGLIIIVASVFLCDSAAYFAGKMFGKHHFSSISPKKTIEGGFAGLIAAVIMSEIGWYFFASDQHNVVWGV
ncbi:MAG: phosphatidate cytidylyltransferase, partial [Fibrobacterota bacterium]